MTKEYLVIYHFDGYDSDWVRLSARKNETVEQLMEKRIKELCDDFGEQVEGHIDHILEIHEDLSVTEL